MDYKLVSNSWASHLSVKPDKQIVYSTLIKVNNIPDTQVFILRNITYIAFNFLKNNIYSCVLVLFISQFLCIHFLSLPTLQIKQS